jgi:Na+-transporting methylmalonyl-CoA/oxaloacetate decarboxylase beta subunit
MYHVKPIKIYIMLKNEENKIKMKTNNFFSQRRKSIYPLFLLPSIFQET